MVFTYKIFTLVLMHNNKHSKENKYCKQSRKINKTCTKNTIKL